MKKSLLKLVAALFVAGVMVGNANAYHPTSTATITIAENADNWVEVQTQNGIKIYFSETELNGKSYLKIKFENTTAQEIEFSCAVIKDAESILNASTNKIEALSSISDESLLVPFGPGETHADFSFNIKIN